jgi:hypothetical protein
MEESMMKEQIMDLLNKIEEDERKYEESIFNKNGKANDKEINNFKKWILKHCENEFSEYNDFAKIINGLNYNGLFLYSLNKKSEYNIYKSNEEWWNDNEDIQEYIFFGDDDISWYCKNKNDGKYYILDKPDGSIMNEYGTFDEIIIKALHISLNIDNE